MRGDPIRPCRGRAVARGLSIEAGELMPLLHHLKTKSSKCEELSALRSQRRSAWRGSACGSACGSKREDTIWRSPGKTEDGARGETKRRGEEANGLALAARSACCSSSASVLKVLTETETETGKESTWQTAPR